MKVKWRFSSELQASKNRSLEYLLSQMLILLNDVDLKWLEHVTDTSLPQTQNEPSPLDNKICQSFKTTFCNNRAVLLTIVNF